MHVALIRSVLDYGSHRRGSAAKVGGSPSSETFCCGVFKTISVSTHIQVEVAAAYSA